MTCMIDITIITPTMVKHITPSTKKPIPGNRIAMRIVKYAACPITGSKSQPNDITSSVLVLIYTAFIICLFADSSSG